MSKGNRITSADLPARYQAQLAKQLYPETPPLTADEAATMPKPKKRLRQSSKPLMNKLETEFYNHLVAQATPTASIFPQAIRLELARGHWYKADFFVPGGYGSDCGCFYEVKGPHAFRGGFENLKVAARRYPFFQFALVWLDDGKWQEQVVLP